MRVHVVVDPHHAGLEAAGDALAARAVERPHRGAEAEAESFASRIASSSESTVTIGTTGPKISSRMIRMSCVTPVSTAGA